MSSSPPLVLASREPVDLVDELSLENGTEYVLSVDGALTVWLFEGTAAPANRHGHRRDPGQTWVFEVEDDPIWVWARKGGAVVVVSSA